MATLSGALTLADFASRVYADNKMGAIVELLSQENEMLDDMLWIEGNLVTGHKTVVRTGIPQGTWRLLNYGVQPTKSSTAAITDTVGNLEAESQIDRDLLKLNNNSAEFRLSEATAHIQGLSQQMASTVWYGNVATNPERFTGLSPRYSTGVVADAQSANNVIDGGGSGSDNASIWIVTWGPNTTHGIFPKGGRGGLIHEDKGEWRVTDAAGGTYYAMVDHYKWEAGLTVRDWRYNVRIANIDVSDLAGGSAANLYNLLIRALNRLPTTASATAVQKSDAATIQGENGRTVIYMNRTLSTYLELQAINKTNTLLTISDLQGKPIRAFRGIPIKISDALLNTEAAVPFS